MLSSPLLSGSGQTGLNLTLSADDNNVNVIDELEAIYGAGSCDGAVTVVVTVLPGVTLWSNNTSAWALDFSGFDFGASLKLVNYGNIYGMGGAGNSGNAGAAMRISRNITINNTTTGKIFGGGGGGGQGGGAEKGLTTCGGGGGGGGQGYSGGAAGSASGGGTYPGTNGTAGSASAAGVGGVGGSEARLAGGGGGAGGGWASAGNNGSDGWVNSDAASPNVAYGGSAGGSPGKAIYKSASCTITWLAGNNATQVKGVVD